MHLWNRSVSLVLAACLATVSMFPMTAAAADVAIAGLDTYTDNVDGNTRTPWVFAETGIGQKGILNVYFAYTFADDEELVGNQVRDTVETRTTASVGAGWRGSLSRTDATYTHREDDDESVDTVAGYHERLFMNGDAGLVLEASRLEASWQVGDDAYADPDEDRTQTTGSIGVYARVSDTVTASGTVRASRQSGYLASPFLAVDIGGTIYAERLPDSRTTTTVEAGIEYYPSGMYNGSATLSRSSDDWDVTSTGIDVSATANFGFRHSVTASGAFRSIDGASFMKPLDEYAATDDEIAIDYALSDHDVTTLGLEYTVRFFDGTPTPFSNHKAALRASIRRIETSDNDYIDYQYGESSIIATMLSVSLDYRY